MVKRGTGTATTTGTKRKAATNTSTNKKTSGNMWNSKKNKKQHSTEAAVTEMFQSIAEDPSDPNSLVNMEGIAELGEKLEIDVTEDIRILVLLWKMDCKEKPGCITANEWTQGCETLQVDSWESLKEQLPGLDTGFLEQTEFKDFYKYCFKFNLSGTHRTLQKELVIELLKLVLKDRVDVERLDSFCQFLEAAGEPYARITMDQWTSFLDFSLEVPDVSNYDEGTSAWPVMIDEYVEYLMEQQQQKS